MAVGATQAASAISDVLGGVAKGISQYKQHKNIASVHAYNAALARSNADLARKIGAFNADRKGEERDYFLSAQVAKFAKAGVRSEGTPAHTMEMTQAKFELEIASIIFESEITARNAESQAQLDTFRENMEKSAAKLALVNNIAEGLTSAAFSSGLGSGGTSKAAGSSGGAGTKIKLSDGKTGIRK